MRRMFVGAKPCSFPVHVSFSIPSLPKFTRKAVCRAAWVSAAWLGFSITAQGSYSSPLSSFEKTPPAASGEIHASTDELIAKLEMQSVQQPGDAEVWYQLGLAYAQANRTDQAISALQKAVALNSSHVLAWENLGGNLHDAHRPKDALDAYQKAIDLGTSDPEVWNSYAMNLLDLGRLPESDKALGHALQLAPRSRRLWNSLGLLRFAQGRKDEALKAYQQALQIDPTYAIAWNNLGVTQADTGNEDDALVSYQNAVRNDPNLGQAWENTAQIYVGRRDVADGEPAAEQAVRILPNDPDGWIFLAICARATQKFEPLVEDYHQAIDVIGLQNSFLKDKRDRALAYAAYGFGCTNIGHYADAGKLLNEALKIDPTASEAWANLAFLQTSEGKIQDALATAQKCLAMDPKQAAGWVTLGSIYLYDLKQPDKAAAAYQKAVEIQPGFSGAWCGLGESDQQLQKKDEAAQAFRHAVQATPGYLEPWQRLGATSSDPAEVDHAFATALALDPNNAMTYGMLGAIYSQRKDWPAAEAALRKSLDLGGEKSVDWSLLSATLFFQQKYPEAADAEEKAIQYGTSWMSHQQLSVAWGCLASAHIYQAKQKGAPEWKAGLDALTHALALDPKNSGDWYQEAMCDDALSRAVDAAAARIQWKATGSRIPLMPGFNAPASAPVAAASPIHVAPSISSSLKSSNAITALLQDRQLSSAYEKAQAETVQRPTDPVSWYDLGNVLLQMRRYDEAAANLTKATALEPKMGPAWFALGNSLAYQHRFDDAVDAFTKSIEFMPDISMNWEALTEVYSSRGDLEDGAEKLRQLLQKHPDNGYGYGSLGAIESAQGQWAQALVDLQRAVQLRPNYSMAWNTLGLTYKDNGQLDKAIESLQRATAADPANVEAWNNLGFDLFTAGKTDEAIASYQRALKINPQHLLALYNLAAAYEKQQQWDLARQACDALARVNPGQANYLRQQIPDPTQSSALLPSPSQAGELHIGGLSNPSSQPAFKPASFSGIAYLDQIGAADLDGYNVMTCTAMILGIAGLVAITFKLNPATHKKKTGQPISRPPPMKPRP